jgi:predicted Holliday junction resolvase-like endonuclease
VDLGLGALVAGVLVVGIGFGFFFGWLYLRGRLEAWKAEFEQEIRKDAIARSGQVTLGKVTEHFAPYFADFVSKYNPRDARFLGTPIDLIVFDGLDDGNLRQIVFVEVKTGKSALSQREKQVRDALAEKRVSYEVFEKFGDRES